MFLSADGLIHLVFLNDNDFYYRDSGLCMSRDQYLWFELHRLHYKAVYFIDKGQDDDICITTRGDCAADIYSPDSTRRKKKVAGFGKWLNQQLTRREDNAAAFVCDLDVFCEIFSAEEYREHLRGLAQRRGRSGIIVLYAPASVEKTVKPLLRARVFDYLGENAILSLRTGELSDMYAKLIKDKGNSCCFLNTFTEEDAKGIIMCTILGREEFYRSKREINAAAEYLTQYVNNDDFRSKENTSKDATHGSRSVAIILRDARPDMPKVKIHQELQNTAVLEELFRRASLMLQAGGMNEYAASRGINKLLTQYDIKPKVYHDADSCAGKCLSVSLSIDMIRDIRNSNSAFSSLTDMKTEAKNAWNSIENRRLSQKVSEFAERASTASERNDSDTFRRAVYAAHTGLRLRYIDPREEENCMELFRKFDELIEMSEWLFNIERSGSSFLSSGGTYSPKFARAMKISSEKEIETFRKTLELQERILTSNVIELEKWRNGTKSMKEMTDRLRAMLTELENSVKDGSLDSYSEEILSSIGGDAGGEAAKGGTQSTAKEAPPPDDDSDGSKKPTKLRPLDPREIRISK